MDMFGKIAHACEAVTHGRIKPDRLARRHRQGMLCFCCTNWDVISQLLLSNVFGMNLPQLTRLDLPPESAPAPLVEPDPLSISALLNR
jgi:hypothetical protein